MALQVAVQFMIAQDQSEDVHRAEEAARRSADWGDSSACLPCWPDLAGMLHDLHQPLAAIRALASAPVSHDAGWDGAAELSQRLRHIGELGDWMSELLRAGSSSLSAVDDPHGADASQVVRDVLLAAAASFSGTLRWRPSGPAPVALDALALRRAFGNVVDNATRAAGPNGWVQVKLRRSRSRIWIDVEDSGPGFGRLRPQSKRGLAVTQSVLASCGGVLEIGSGRSGGAMVRMKLPLAVQNLSA